MGKWGTDFGFPLSIRFVVRPVGNVRIAKRFPRTESGLCFPAVRHFHKLILFGRHVGFCFLGPLDSITRNVERESRNVNKAVDRCCCGHRVFKDAFPLGDRQIDSYARVNSRVSMMSFTAALSRSVRCSWGTPRTSQTAFCSPSLKLSNVSE